MQDCIGGSKAFNDNAMKMKRIHNLGNYSCQLEPECDYNARQSGGDTNL